MLKCGCFGVNCALAIDVYEYTVYVACRSLEYLELERWMLNIEYSAFVTAAPFAPLSVVGVLMLPSVRIKILKLIAGVYLLQISHQVTNNKSEMPHPTYPL